MTDTELDAILKRKRVEAYRRVVAAAKKRRAYEAEHQQRLQEALVA